MSLTTLYGSFWWIPRQTPRGLVSGPPLQLRHCPRLPPRRPPCRPPPLHGAPRISGRKTVVYTNEFAQCSIPFIFPTCCRRKRRGCDRVRQRPEATGKLPPQKAQRAERSSYRQRARAGGGDLTSGSSRSGRVATCRWCWLGWLQSCRGPRPPSCQCRARPTTAEILNSKYPSLIFMYELGRALTFQSFCKPSGPRLGRSRRSRAGR